MNKLEQLKQELKEKEKELTKINKKSMLFQDSYDRKILLQAEISALKKGISACEEILNSQQNKMTSNQGMVSNPNLTEVNRTTGSADTEQEKAEGVVYPKGDSDTSPVLFDDQLIECAKNNFKKGQEQERKRILEIIDKWETKQPIDQKYKVEKKGIFYNIYNVSELNLQELKKQLTTEEGKK